METTDALWGKSLFRQRESGTRGRAAGTPRRVRGRGGAARHAHPRSQRGAEVARCHGRRQLCLGVCQLVGECQSTFEKNPESAIKFYIPAHRVCDI